MFASGAEQAVNRERVEGIRRDDFEEKMHSI